MKKILTASLLALTTLVPLVTLAQASSSEADLGVAYLRANQDVSGKINGYGGESQWAAIAFAASGVDVTMVKNPTISLKDFLLSDVPSDTAAATEWERRILAIVAIGENPSNFGGVNYVAKLEALHNNDQLGEITLLNDDIFGLLALIASGELANQDIKEDALAFIISHQGSDGGFSWSADSSCAWCGSDGNDTAAALQALYAAKTSGMTHPDLDTTIEEAKTYFYSTQKSDGGFAYDGYSDADGSSTAWALTTLNALGLSSSTEAIAATAWLLNDQADDGGFQWMSGYGSDTYTTSFAVTALQGKSLIVRRYSRAVEPSPTPTASPSSTPTVTPSPSPTVSPSPSPTPSTSPSPSPSPSSSTITSSTPSPTPSPTPQASTPPRVGVTRRQPQVLGSTTQNDDVESETEMADSATPSPQPTASPEPSENNEEGLQTSSLKKTIVIATLLLGGVGTLIAGLRIWELKKGN